MYQKGREGKWEGEEGKEGGREGKGGRKRERERGRHSPFQWADVSYEVNILLSICNSYFNKARKNKDSLSYKLKEFGENFLDISTLLSLFNQTHINMHLDHLHSCYNK